MAEALAAGARRRSLVNALVATPPPKGQVKRIHKKSPGSVGASESTVTPEAKRLMQGSSEGSAGSKASTGPLEAAAPTALSTTAVELFPSTGGEVKVVEVADTQVEATQEEQGGGSYIYTYTLYKQFYCLIYIWNNVAIVVHIKETS